MVGLKRVSTYKRCFGISDFSNIMSCQTNYLFSFRNIISEFSFQSKYPGILA